MLLLVLLLLFAFGEGERIFSKQAPFPFGFASLLLQLGLAAIFPSQMPLHTPAAAALLKH